MSMESLSQPPNSSTTIVIKQVDLAEETVSSSTLDDKQYVIVQWYLQQHGSFSSGGRSRDISLTQFSSTQQLTDYFLQYIKKNYPHVDITDGQYNVFDLCRISIDESNRLLASNQSEISRVTSRHIWPPSHKLLMGCLMNAHIIATCYDQFTKDEQIQHEEQNNNATIYCLITQLGNHPTHVQFLHGNNSLREEILQRFKCPFKTTSKPSEEQCDLFFHKTQTFSIPQFCHYVTSQSWHDLDTNSLHGTLVDFIIAGEPLLFNEQI